MAERSDASIPANVKEFSEITAVIFSELYASFPVERDFMRKSISCVALGVWLVAGPLIATRPDTRADNRRVGNGDAVGRLGDAVARARRRAAIWRSAAASRAPHRRRRAGQDGANGADCGKGCAYHHTPPRRASADRRPSGDNANVGAGRCGPSRDDHADHDQARKHSDRT